MNMRHRLPHYLIRTFGGFLVIALSISQANATPASERFELNGMTQLGDTWGFSVRDLENNSSFWIELHQTLGDVRAVAYDVEGGILSLSVNGKTVELPISSASNRSLPVATSRKTAGSEERTPSGALPKGAPPEPPNGGAPPETPPPAEKPDTSGIRQLLKNRK